MVKLQKPFFICWLRGIRKDMIGTLVILIFKCQWWLWVSGLRHLLHSIQNQTVGHTDFVIIVSKSSMCFGKTQHPCTSCLKNNDPIFKKSYLIRKMCHSCKRNYKLSSKPSSFTRHNYKRSMCPPPAARTSTRQLNSSQTGLRVTSVKDFTSAVILFVSSSKSAGNGGCKNIRF
jgi:hypothetical protein